MTPCRRDGRKPTGAGTRIARVGLRWARGTGGLPPDLFRFQQGSYRFKGVRVNHPEVTRVDLHASPPTAATKDCLDISNWTVHSTVPGGSASKAPGTRRRSPRRHGPGGCPAARGAAA
ncbi:hypothetical protein Kpho01_27070 [Kitasatospora phosalacinea]|uniref:Uncharacterized protein n=1 Tax=Kitasatospora phosalacinea TaxID=2065 RepID=A0A9W6PGI2_9ACTN|nr:hypothetical protein Kpho01_27070 [Kitasatospora phosalacinea]